MSAKSSVKNRNQSEILKILLQKFMWRRSWMIFIEILYRKYVRHAWILN